MHWTDYLPEAGRQAQSLGRQQKLKAQQIADAIESLKILQLEYADEEKNIMEIIRRDWTDQEINLAFKQAELEIMTA